MEHTHARAHRWFIRTRCTLSASHGLGVRGSAWPISKRYTMPNRGFGGNNSGLGMRIVIGGRARCARMHGRVWVRVGHIINTPFILATHIHCSLVGVCGRISNWIIEWSINIDSHHYRELLLPTVASVAATADGGDGKSAWKVCTNCSSRTLIEFMLVQIWTQINEYEHIYCFNCLYALSNIVYCLWSYNNCPTKLQTTQYTRYMIIYLVRV